MGMLFGYTIDDAIEGIKKYIREMMKGYVNDVHENMIKNYTGINSWTLYNKNINGYTTELSIGDSFLFWEKKLKLIVWEFPMLLLYFQYLINASFPHCGIWRL